MTASTAASSLIIGSAPDSWGVWFPSDPRQLDAQTFLDEVAGAGYEWIELGPYGYLPTDPAQLEEDLASRSLSLSAGTVFEHLHRPDSWDSVWQQVSDVAGLARTQGSDYIVVIPDMWRDPSTGVVIEDRNLDPAGWNRLATGMNRLGRAVHDEYGMHIAFHPHADSHVATNEHVERFLQATDPDVVNLCLDTGHLSYCGGDNLALIARHSSRINYVHLKQVDPAVKQLVDEQDLPFGEAVRLGAMCEPPHGIPDMPPVLEALEQIGVPLFAIVEQDLYPCAPEVPFPIAMRTHAYLNTCRPVRSH
jgi:inosose dehydratase